MSRHLLKGTRGHALIAVVGCVIALGLWLFLWNSGKNDPSSHRVSQGMPISVDHPAPEFTQPLLSGHGSFRLGSHPGQVTVVNFWASWCVACRTETPELNELSKSYRGAGVRFVGIDYMDRHDAAVRFARSFHLAYPVVSDPDGKVGDAFGIFGLPTTFIVTPDGRIHYVVDGKLQVESFTAALESSLGSGTPEAPAG